MNPTLRQAAEQLVSAQFGGIDCSDMSDHSLQHAVNETFLGGWSRFTQTYLPHPKSTTLTPHQLRAKVERTTGYQIKLGMFEEIEKIVLEPEKITVLIRAVSITETSREWRVQKSGRRLISLTAKAEDHTVWWYSDELTIWDDTSLPTVYTKAESCTDQYDRLEWERMCYRPGNAKFPLDNFDSTDSKKMERHWGK